MAVTGVLAADFSSFLTACDQATVKLVSMESGAATVDRSLSKMVDSFSGRKVIQEATLMAEAIERSGGVTRLTGSELERAGAKAAEAAEKMRALGLDVPAGIQRLADSATKANTETSLFSGSFARLTASFTAASLIDRGVSALFSWGGAALDAASKTVDLANKTGLSTATIQEMAHVAAQTGTSLDALANAAFRLGVKIAGGSDSVMAAARALGLEWTTLRDMRPDEQFDLVTAALREMEDPQERNRLAVELFGRVAGEVMPAIVQGYRDIANEARISGDEQVRSVDAAGDAWDKFKSDLGSAITSAVGNFILASQWLGTIGLRLSGVKTEVERLTGAQAANTDEATENTAKLQDWGGRLLDATTKVYGLDRSMMDQIATAQRMGASAADLSAQFKLNADDLRVLAERVREETAAKAASIRVTEDATDASARFSRENTIKGDVLNGVIQSTGEAIWAEEAYRSELVFTTETIALQADSLDLLADKKRADAEASRAAAAAQAEVNRVFQQSLQTQLPTLSDEQLAVMSGPSGGDERIWQKLADLEAGEARGPRGLYEGVITREQAFEAQEMVYLLAQLRQWAEGRVRPPGFSAGVESFGGGLAYVHQDELLVNLPSGTDVIPAGRGGGSSVVNNTFHLSGMVGDRQGLARAIEQILIDRSMGTGRRLAVGV